MTKVYTILILLFTGILVASLLTFSFLYFMHHPQEMSETEQIYASHTKKNIDPFTQQEFEKIIQIENFQMLEQKSKDAKKPTNESYQNTPISFMRIPIKSSDKSTKKGRLLADKNILTDPGIISFDTQDSSKQETAAYRFIFNNLKIHSSSLILYPYNFLYSPNETDSSFDQSYKNGAIFTIKPDTLPNDTTSTTFFKNVRANANVTFGKAKAIYDMNIGIFKLEDFFDDIYKDLTYESADYCEALATTLGKYKECMTSANYLKFKADYKNNGKTALVYLNPDDFKTTDLLFLPDGAPRFQMIIIPDHLTAAHELITQKLSPAGISNIKLYLDRGGFILASGKSGFLLEFWNILPQGMYDTTQLMTSQGPNQVEALNGCENIESTTDFTKATLCMNVTLGGKGHSYLLSAYMVNTTKMTSSVKTIMEYDKTAGTIKKKDLEGNTYDLTTEEQESIPFSMYATYGKGKIYLINGNPLFMGDYSVIFYNTMLLAMSKNVLIDAYIGSKDGKPIPGGEAGVQLDIKLTFMNLFDKDLTNVGLHLWFPMNVSISSKPDSCISDNTDLSLIINTSMLNESSHLKCGVNELAGFGKYEALLNIEILDHQVTQSKYDILMAAPAVVYTDTETGVTFQYDLDGLRTDGALAARLAAGLNPDPMGFWPPRGRGQWTDNVLEVENKEDTDALEPEYIGYVPLISPLLDNSDQTVTLRTLKFLPSYYNTSTRKYWYPFKDEVDKNVDFIDYAWLNGRDVTLVSDWDIPVKKGKIVRNASLFPPPDSPTSEFDIKNMNFSTTISSKNTVLKQIYYDKADLFFELASQRELVFVDTAKEKGANTLYPDGIPENVKNPNKPTVAKKEFIFIRNDVYFYSASDYLMPENINYTHVISIDRYPSYTGPCVEKFGDARAVKEKPGYFTIEKEDGLKHNEYSNELLMYCERKKVWLNDVEKLSNGSIKAVHYLVPMTDDEVSRADDIQDFIVEPDGQGYMEDYPELRFIYAHSFNVMSPGEMSRQGGKFIVTLPEGVGFVNNDDPIAKGYITYSADQVSFYKTEYDPATRQITSWFKRGLASNEAYGKPSNLNIMIESLTTKTSLIAAIDIYEMKFDISAHELKYERYTLRQRTTVNLVPGKFWSMPAVEIHTKVNRNNKTNIFPYELLSPYTRYGIYIQELKKHTTVWCTVESHYPSDPGIQANSNAFAIISNLGISSIPFIEYVTVGKGQLIPSSPLTARIEWTDIWGRRWSQPLRSLFPDIPPLPGPLRNFMMTTTFELTKAGTKERVLEWNSDESLDIWILIKLWNTYSRYFEITTCKQNQIQKYMGNPVESRYTIDPPPYPEQIPSAEATDSSYYINFATRSVYGVCYAEEGTILRGNLVSADDRHLIEFAYLCADTLDEAKILQCIQEYAHLPTVTRRVAGNTAQYWIYSPRVDRYYPKNYITLNMWDLTHEDYDDTPMYKAYNYHFDNCLPNLDPGPNGNPAMYKPHNVISQPIFKGFGYLISYDKQKTLARFPDRKGWWSDQLQNKDGTLLAGQATVNEISVDKKTELLTPDMWINARDLKNPVNPNLARNRLKNIHVCLYNQHRIRMNKTQPIMAYPSNVVQNNIIPIIPDLDRYDDRLYNYNCDGVYQYSPYNISQVDNIVVTPTIRDYLYFAANLRGEARETINVPYTLKPYPGVKYEGYTKVNDGGMMTYWNPALGPNAFGVVGSPVSVIIAKRSDLTIDVEVIPKTASTFKPVLYHVLTIQDPAEILREWKFHTYINHYGFGDVSTSVYVGGAQGTECILQPGDYTLAKIMFYNNAGFDWNMFASAMDVTQIGEQPINANDLIAGRKTAIMAPSKYNFMVPKIPEELKPYIEMGPSLHRIDVAPQFFDLMNINSATIKDGFNSEFYYRINISESLPDNLRGKVYEIPIELNETHFDKLPSSYNDPTVKGFHDYHIKIPSIKIAFPYKDGKYAGKIFYTSGYSTNLIATAKVPSYWNVTKAVLISEEQLEEVRAQSAKRDKYTDFLKSYWNELLTNNTDIPISETISGDNKILTLNFSKAFPTFPKPNGTEPDIASFKVIFRTTTDDIQRGTVRVITGPQIFYKDFTNKTKSDIIAEPLDKTVESHGAWLKVWCTSKLVTQASGKFVELKDQSMYADDTNGTFRINIYAQNTGDDYAYDVKYSVTMAPGVTLLTNSIPSTLIYTLSTSSEGTTTLNIDTQKDFSPNDIEPAVIYVNYQKPTGRRLLASSTSITLITEAKIAINLGKTAGSVKAEKIIPEPLKITKLSRPRDTVSLSVDSEYDGQILQMLGAINPIPALSGTTNIAVRSRVLREILEINCMDNPDDQLNGLCKNINKTKQEIKPKNAVHTFTDLPIPGTFTGIVRSGRYKYYVETYSHTNGLLATTTWEGIAELRLGVGKIGKNKVYVNPTQEKNEENDVSVKGIEEIELNDTNKTIVDENHEDDGYGLPVWAIVIIPICAVAIILVAAVFIYRRYNMAKIVPVNISETQSPVFTDAGPAPQPQDIVSKA